MDYKSKSSGCSSNAISPITGYTGTCGGRGGAGGTAEGGAEIFSNKIVYNSGENARKQS